MVLCLYNELRMSLQNADEQWWIGLVGIKEKYHGFMKGVLLDRLNKSGIVWAPWQTGRRLYIKNTAS